MNESSKTYRFFSSNDLSDLETAENSQINGQTIPAGTRLIDIFPNGIVVDLNGNIMDIHTKPVILEIPSAPASPEAPSNQPVVA